MRSRARHGTWRVVALRRQAACWGWGASWAQKELPFCLDPLLSALSHFNTGEDLNTRINYYYSVPPRPARRATRAGRAGRGWCSACAGVHGLCARQRPGLDGAQVLDVDCSGSVSCRELTEGLRKMKVSALTSRDLWSG